MDGEILYVIILLIFIAIIGYVFFNCNCSCSCGVREGFSSMCACANGTGSTSRTYCSPGSRWRAYVGDYCKKCDHGEPKAWRHDGNKWQKECDPPPPVVPAADKAAAEEDEECKACEDDSRVQYGECQKDGYPKCEDISSSYKKTSKNNFTLGDKVEVSNQNCDWQETNDNNKIKRYDDKICTYATSYIPQSSIGSSRGAAQAMTINDLTNYCNSVPSCYGWARNNQHGDHKVKLCKKNPSSTTNLNNSSHYDVYTCDSDYVCPAGYEKIFNSSENKYECSTCPAGKYKSGKNANDCVPCKSSCPSGKTLNGSCPSGSTSDTKTCVQTPTVGTNSYTTVNINYKPTNGKTFMGYSINSEDKAKNKCDDLGSNCAVVYEKAYPNRSYFWSVTEQEERPSGRVEAYWRKKYVKN